jgi:hypothetical protein
MEVVLDRLLRALPDLVVLIVSLLGQVTGVVWLIGWRAAGASHRTKVWIAAAGALSMAASLLAFLLRFPRVARHFPGWWISWGTALAIAWAMLSLGWVAGTQPRAQAFLPGRLCRGIRCAPGRARLWRIHRAPSTIPA